MASSWGVIYLGQTYIRQQDLKKHCYLIFEFSLPHASTKSMKFLKICVRLDLIGVSQLIIYPLLLIQVLFCSNNWALTDIRDYIFGIGKLHFCNVLQQILHITTSNTSSRFSFITKKLHFWGHVVWGNVTCSKLQPITCY